MDSTTPNTSAVLDTALTDARAVPLARIAAADLLDRLRPSESAKVAVAAFNASL